MGWPVVHASGGPRECGRAYGAAARERVQRSIELYGAVFRHYTGLGWSDVRDRAGTFAPWFDQTDTHLLPELEGIAEGAGVDAEDVLALNVRTEVMFGFDARAARVAAKECTAIAAGAGATVEGRVLVAQNWDWKPGARDTCVLLAMRPTGRPAFVTLVEAGLLAKCGVNTAGIGLAANALTSSRDRGQPGVPFHAILRRVLTSTSLDEASLADRGSRASLVGQLPDRFERRTDRRSRGRAGRRRYGMEDRGERALPREPLRAPRSSVQGPRPARGRESPIRHEAIEASIGEGPIDAASIELALRSHAGPDHGDGSICVHGTPGRRPRPTIGRSPVWSWI